MMDGVKDKPSLEELLRHSKIVSIHNECTRPKTDNLRRILEAVDGTKFKSEDPVAIVAVIGPKGSGKSFLTNFLIHNLKQGGEGGWMSSLIGQNRFAEGFSFGSISSEYLYEPDPKKEELSGSTSGVYLWPEPFLMKTRNGNEDNNLVVWIMHLHSVENDRKENLAVLERFLMLICSRIMEIKWKNDEEFRMLQHSQFLCDYDPALQKQICDSVVYTFRSGENISADTDDEAMEALKSLLQEAGKSEDAYLKSLSNLKHVNITWMKDFPQPLHDGKGKFSVKMKTAQKPIRNIVDKMLEESEIGQKSGGEYQLTLGNMLQFVETAANKILAIDPITAQNPNEKLHAGNPTCQLPNSKYGIPKERIATATNDNGTTPLNNETPRPLEKSHAKRESFPSEMISPLATNAKVEGGNDKFLVSVDKGEEIKNFGAHKDQNQNTTQIVKRQIHQSPSVDSVPPGTPKPSNSDQNVEALNNLDSQMAMEVDQLSRYEISEASTVLEREGNGRNSTEPMDVDDDGMVKKAFQELQDGKSNEAELKKSQTEEKMAAHKLEKKQEDAKKKKQEENRKREQERQKREEEKRRQEEEARNEMMECVNIAAIQVRQIFPYSIKLWIDRHFNFSNLNEIETIYAHSFPGTIEEHRKVVSPKLWNEFVSLVDRHCKNECISVLRSISEPVLQLNRGMKKQFDLHGYFNAPKFEKMFSEEFQKLQIPQEELISGMIKLATDKLYFIYQQHNDLIVQEEQNTLKIASSQIENIYHDQMKRYMQDAPYSPQKLDAIHKKLVEKLADAFKNACHMSNTVNSFIGTIENPLKETLGKAYMMYETSNETKLRKLQIEINKIVSKSKSNYTENIEAVLKQYPDGVEVRILAKHNDTIKAEAMKLLEMEIRPKREDEPVEIHQKNLQGHIDNYWPAVLKANHKNMERKKERDEEGQRQRKKAEAKRKLQQQEAVTEGRKSGASSTAVSQPQLQQNKSNRNSMTQTQVDKKPLLETPLVFHLQSSRITMAMDINGHPEVLENEFGEKQTSACVAFTSENKFVYGSTALALAHEDKSDSGTIIFWSVADFFLNSSCCRSRTARVCINGTEHEITTEFFLAVLINNLKETVEHKMGCRVTKTVLAIPFSFSSPQRIQVKDAAKIAGFSEVYLVNEASAAAYNFVLSEIRSDSAGEVLVISENFDLVDAFVYQYNGCSKKLIMLAHASNYETENEKKKASLLRKISKGISHAVTIFLNYMSPNDNECHDDVTTGCVRKVCKFAIDEAYIRKSKPLEMMESLYLCENLERWNGTLSTVARDFGRKACDINQENAVVVGVVALSKDAKKIGGTVRDKLAYSVCRTQLPAGKVEVCPWKIPLLPTAKKLSSSLPGGVCETTFYQDVLGNAHEIGSLSVTERVQKDEYIEPSLDVNNEGIVKFKYVAKNSSRSNMKSTSAEHIHEAQVTWKTPNLTDEQLAMMISLLDSMKTPKEDPALVQAKTYVLEKCQEMEKKIAGDKFKLKSDLAKEMVAGKIAEAKQFAIHAKASLDDILKQMDSLQRLCDKYEKK